MTEQDASIGGERSGQLPSEAIVCKTEKCKGKRRVTGSHLHGSVARSHADESRLMTPPVPEIDLREHFGLLPTFIKSDHGTWGNPKAQQGFIGASRAYRAREFVARGCEDAESPSVGQRWDCAGKYIVV